MAKSKRPAVRSANRRKGQDAQPTFYGGLKSKHELYFQLASLFKEATKGNLPLSSLWIDQFMTQSKPSGKFI